LLAGNKFVCRYIEVNSYSFSSQRFIEVHLEIFFTPSENPEKASRAIALVIACERASSGIAPPGKI
jgi:hypothetical protein